jgi:signal transduction histidine kinase
MRERHTTPLQRLRWSLLSIPIFVKTLGIGAIVATLFGGIIFVRTRQNLTTSLYEVLQERAGAETGMLASHLERPMTLHDLVRVQEVVDEAKNTNPDISYIIVRDDQRQVICHSFEAALPSDPSVLPERTIRFADAVRILDTRGDGLVFEAARPLVRGYAGYVQLGLSDRMVRTQVKTLTVSIISGLVISVAVGVGLAAFLSFLITQPIQHLKRVAGQIKGGDFESRSLIYSDDEIGELAEAFNEMADSLHHYRQEVQEREESRLALIERVVSSHEKERKLISRELHDQFGQSLLAVLVDIRAARDKAGSSTPVLQKLEKTMEKIIDDLNRIVRGMRPTILDDYGLVLALESYANQVSERYGIGIAYRHNCPDGLDRLSGHVEVSLFRIVQETINNVIKHAEATCVSLVLLVSPEACILLIEDDGKGFDPSAVQGQGGLGLVGMRERATLLGGKLDIDSSDGEGTTVRVTIPNNRNDGNDQTSHS